MKNSIILLVVALVLPLFASAQEALVMGWQTNVGTEVLDAQYFDGDTYSLVQGAQTMLIKNNATGQQVWSQNVTGAQMLKLTSHGIVLLTSTGASLRSYSTGSVVTNFNFSVGAIGNGQTYHHEDVYANASALFLVGVLHDSNNNTWTVHVKKLSATTSYWDYAYTAVANRSTRPVIAYGRGDNITVTYLTGPSTLNIYEVNTNSGTLGQNVQNKDMYDYPEFSLLTGSIELLKARLVGDLQYLMFQVEDHVVVYSKHLQDPPTVVNISSQQRNMNFMVAGSDITPNWEFGPNGEVYLLPGGRELYALHNNTVHVTLNYAANAGQILNSPRMSHYGNRLAVIVHDPTDNTTKMMIFDSNLNLVGNGSFAGGSGHFLSGVRLVPSAMLLYGHNPSASHLSYWSGGSLNGNDSDWEDTDGDGLDDDDDITSVIEPMKSMPKVKLYPNPTVDYVRVDGISGSYVIRDLKGIVVQAGFYEAGNDIQLQIEDTGVYFIQVCDTKTSVTKRFIKR